MLDVTLDVTLDVPYTQHPRPSTLQDHIVTLDIPCTQPFTYPIRNTRPLTPQERIVTLDLPCTVCRVYATLYDYVPRYATLYVPSTLYAQGSVRPV